MIEFESRYIELYICELQSSLNNQPEKTLFLMHIHDGEEAVFKPDAKLESR